MTRILQIRRGSAAQNEQFTGMPGELSFDTDNKTLRVHDGEALGGYPLARADQIGDGAGSDGTSDFDIASVPASFWQDLFATYTPTPVKIITSAPSMIGNVSYIENIFDLDATPKLANVSLVCQSAEAGYSVGDTVAAFGIGGRANPIPVTYQSTDGIHVRMMVGGESFWVSHKNTGATTNITNANWRAKFTVWY